MNTKTIVRALVAALLIGGVGYAGYRIGMERGMQMGDPAAAAPAATGLKAGDADPSSGKKILYWHDPMVPAQKFDRPGKSPFMDMQLVPVYADGNGDEGGVSVSARVQQNLGVRIAEVTKGTMTPSVEAVGSVAYNEREIALVQARAGGFLEKLYVRAPLDPVHKGQPLAELYVPDWVAAQEDFLAARRVSTPGLDGLPDAARQRMRLAGMSEAQIRVVESSGTVQARMTLSAPIDGVVAELGAREGMTVMPGATLFRINGLSTVWVNAEVPESQAALLRPGAAVEARAPALPGTMFKGKVQAILPELNPATRTIKARIELANPGLRLAPGMFATIALGTQAEPALMVPTEAVIQTGRRTVVIVADGKGGFRPVDVEIGPESKGQTEIKRGLEAGQKVVVSGQFLVDSEANLRASGTRMEDAAPTLPAAATEHTGEAKIEAVHKDSVTLSHGPIVSLHWGPMTMDFAAPVTGLPPGLKPGQSVKFAFTLSQDGQPVLTHIEPMEQPR